VASSLLGQQGRTSSNMSTLAGLRRSESLLLKPATPSLVLDSVRRWRVVHQNSHSGLITVRSQRWSVVVFLFTHLFVLQNSERWSAHQPFNRPPNPHESAPS
jgi:hypothetical protein